MAPRGNSSEFISPPQIILKLPEIIRKNQTKFTKAKNKECFLDRDIPKSELRIGPWSSPTVNIFSGISLEQLGTKQLR